VDGTTLRDARLRKKWTQQEAAQALGVTQAYLSMIEKGRRVVSDRLVRKAQRMLNLPATALPLESEHEKMTAASRKLDFSAELGALGYPAFAYRRARTRHNPAEVLFAALNEQDLDARVAEALPWLALHFVDMDWDWLVRNAKLHDRQNRLGFTVSLAKDVAETKHDDRRAQELRKCVQVLEGSRLVREDTFCHDSMTHSERDWLRQNRSPLAKHWNLLTDLKQEDLVYSSLEITHWRQPLLTEFYSGLVFGSLGRSDRVPSGKMCGKATGH
jgi:transcriptional regulator with XRE-family HTH domain